MLDALYSAAWIGYLVGALVVGAALGVKEAQEEAERNRPPASVVVEPEDPALVERARYRCGLLGEHGPACEARELEYLKVSLGLKR